MPKKNISIAVKRLLFSHPKMENHFNSISSEEDQYTYAIVNAAGTDKVMMNLEAYDPESRILYYDDEADELEEVAPWLVKLKPDEPFTEWLFEECMNERLLLFIQSTEEIDTLAEHFRFYTKAEIPNNEENEDDHDIAYFSFYDPNVFSTWAKSLTKDEALHFFQPITNTWFENKNQFTLFYMATDGWKHKQHSLIEDSDEATKQNIKESL